LTIPAYSPEISESLVDNSTHSHQVELLIENKTRAELTLSELYDILQDQGKKLNEIQDTLEYSSLVNTKNFNILYQQQESNPMRAIEGVKQQVNTIDQGMMKIHHYLKEDSVGKELKAGQQNLQKVIVSTIEANQNKTTTKTSYLDWQQIAIIVTATALISSLCSLAVFQLASNWKTDQPQNPVEKPLKPKSKKSSK
jgi:hypothetical protein